MNDLDTIAKIILADHADLFTQTHQQFLEDKATVIEEDEFSRYLAEDSESDDLLWAFAFVHHRIEWIDWSGEEDPEQLKRFVDARMESLAKEKMDWSFLDEFEKGIDFSKLKRGEYIVRKFKCIDTEIRKHGYLIALLDRGDDQFHPFVASVVDFQQIAGAEFGISRTVAFADQ